MLDIFKDFCENTTLHGWNRLLESSTWKNLYWCTVITLSVTIGSFIGFKTIVQFGEDTVETKLTTNTAPISMASYPKLSICNSYLVRQSFLDEAFGDKYQFFSKSDEKCFSISFFCFT